MQVSQNTVFARQRNMADPVLLLGTFAVKHSAGGSTRRAMSAARQLSVPDALGTVSVMLASD